MTESDNQAFGVLFLKLRNVFNLRGDKADVREAMQAYFTVLRRYPLGAVEAGADAWLEAGTRFPKPAEWRRAIPQDPTRIGLVELEPAEASEHRAAVAQWYQADPCRCYLCQQAGVSHRFLRYVPDEDSDGLDLKGLLDGKPVVRGHWAHGDELAQWYAARERYQALKERYPLKRMSSAKKPLIEMLITRVEKRVAALEANPPVMESEL